MSETAGNARATATGSPSSPLSSPLFRGVWIATVECFIDESWVGRLRQHERTSVADRNTPNRAKGFLVAGTQSKSPHWLGDREQ